MTIVPAATTELGAGRGALLHASEVETGTIDRWREEVRALKPSKRGKWHSRLWGPCGVAERVRYAGGVKYFELWNRLVPYEFESYKPPVRVVGGGVWWPVMDHGQSRVTWGVDGSSFGQRMRQHPDRWTTFRSIQAEEAEETTAPSEGANERVDNLMARDEEQYGAFCASLAKSFREKGMGRILDTTAASPRLFQEIQEFTDFLGKDPEALSGAELKRACKKLKKVVTFHTRAEQASSSESSAPVTAAAPLSVANAPVALLGGVTEADREVQRANEEARARKLLAKKAVPQQPLAGSTAEADDAAGQPAPAEANLSKNARRRQEKKAKQQRAEQRRIDEKQQRADDEFRRVLKAVEPLRLESGTVVREDLECLDSLRELDIQLKKEEKQTKTKPRRAPTQAEAEVAHALLETGQLRCRMRQEVEAFVRGCSGIAPGAEAFAETLVDALLIGGAGGWHDAREAAELYGDFADAYAAHSWMEPRLERVRRKVVLRAAALA